MGRARNRSPDDQPRPGVTRRAVLSELSCRNSEDFRLPAYRAACGGGGLVFDQPATEADQDRRPRCAPRPRHHLPTGRGGRHRPDGARHPRSHPPIANASAMRMTAIHAQLERERQDRSVRCAEKHHRRARTQRLGGLIGPVPAARHTAGVAQGGKCLSNGRIQAIFASDRMPLGEFRLEQKILGIAKVIFVSAASLIASSSACYSEGPYVNQPMRFSSGCDGNSLESCWILAEGVITSGTANRFREYIDGVESTYVILSSPGGVLSEGVRLGRVIREAGLITMIEGQCLSACAYAFLGGSLRSFLSQTSSLRNNILGFHQFSSDLQLSEVQSQQIVAEVLAYVLEMGVDARVFISASRTAPSDFFMSTMSQLEI
jgi:hypothetical protein